jgi:TetR/AcrR family transcriptional repressor of lmrAB and yxaGH operons
MSKQTHIPSLFKLFCQFGYEGVTLTKISQETGLGKASLYHHFPKGKAEMAEAALSYVSQYFEDNVLTILTVEDILEGNCKGKAIAKFQLMCEEINRLFNGGKNSCLWAVLIMEQSSDELFYPQISRAFSMWIEAIAKVLVAAGLDATLAKQRGEDTIIAIQGALILSHGLKDLAPFQRVIKQLPQQLCQDI